MTDSIISLRVDKETLNKMRRYDEVNWSAFLRNCLNQKLERTNIANKNKMKKAEDIMKRMSEISKTKGGDKTTTEIIREWRDKRR